MKPSSFRLFVVPAHRRGLPRVPLVHLVASTSAVLALLGPGLADAASPKTPDAIRQARVLGTIEDRVRIDLETAGGELDHARIEVAAEPGGRIVLSGRVPSPTARARAGELASFAVGVSEVQNALEVDPQLAPPAPAVRAGPPESGIGSSAPDARPPSDEALAERVARQIAGSLPVEARAQHRWLRGWRVVGEAWSFEVDVEDGKVRLDGSVREPLTAEDVTASARALTAVRAVDASLEVVDADHRPGFFERLF